MELICPTCGSEYREGFTRCEDCDAALVEPPAPSMEHAEGLVKVYTTADPVIIPLIESVFEDAGVEYMTKGHGNQDVFGQGRFAMTHTFVIGPVEFYVWKDAEAAAREILAALEAPVTAPDETVDEPAGEDRG
jgi:hypothetical protein